MANEQTKTVTVEALQGHSYNGEQYEVGDTYEIAADLVDSVAIQGKAVRVDRAAVAKAQKTDAAKAKRTTAVEPMAIKPTSGKAKAAKKSRR